MKRPFSDHNYPKLSNPQKGAGFALASFLERKIDSLKAADKSLSALKKCAFKLLFLRQKKPPSFSPLKGYNKTCAFNGALTIPFPLVVVDCSPCSVMRRFNSLLGNINRGQL